MKVLSTSYMRRTHCTPNVWAVLKRGRSEGKGKGKEKGKAGAVGKLRRLGGSNHYSIARDTTTL